MNKWILFIHQIAQDAPNLRVKVWRMLKKYGAVLFKNAVYILPCTKEHEEIMQWLCKYIKDSGSDASLFITESLSREQDEEFIKTFHEVRNKEYFEVFDACNNLLQKIEQKEETDGITDRSSDVLKKKLNEIIKNTEDISKIYFFYSPQKDKVFDKIYFIQQKLNGWQKASEKGIPDIGKNCKVKDFLGKKWVTRKDIFIDRIASAWLIKRFIDSKATFLFASETRKKPPSGAIPFDMYGAEFTHHGDDCTFETLLKAFNLKDPALQQIAEIVHDIDLKDNKYNRKEAEGIENIIKGISQKLKNDTKLLEKGMEIFDALYLSYSSKGE